MILVAAVAMAAGVAVGVFLTLHISRPPASSLDAAVEELRRQSAGDRDAAIRAALEQSAIMNRESLAVHLAAGQHELAAKGQLIDVRLEQVQSDVKREVTRLAELVSQLGHSNSRSFGEVAAALSAHAESTASLAGTAQGLREALASPKVRGQWGERMAEDVLRLAGFVEHINYEKQTAVDGGTGLPDFTFPLPKGHQLYMDVKFPLTAYLRFLDAGTDAERAAHRGSFLRDVRLRVRELAARDYARQCGRTAVDYVLLFLPNETLAGFIYEHDPELVDDALRQKVVMCSPLTLFAMLGVIRQAFDNFMIEQTSDEILGVLGTFDLQWEKFAGALDTMGKRLESAQRAFDDLNGPRRRQLERPLARLDALRTERGLTIDRPDEDDSFSDVLTFDRRGGLSAG